jgi:transposase
MRQKSNSTPVTSEKLVRNIRRATRKHHPAEEKIRIVLDGLRGESSIATANVSDLATKLKLSSESRFWPEYSTI